MHTAQRIEHHRFEPVRRVRYRNADLDFSTAHTLLNSLQAAPPAPYLASVPDALDLHALRALLDHPHVVERTRSPEAVERLWAVCQIPDFRHILFEVHLELLRDVYLALSEGPLSDDFLAARTQEFAREDGDVDTIVARIARLRTWAYVVNRTGFCAHSQHWSGKLSELEDRLSDALHTSLVSTFVERRAKARRLARPAERRSRLAKEEESIDQHHPFAALRKLRLHAHESFTDSGEPASLGELVDAPHEAFQLDGRGRISSQGLELARLVRGSSLITPNVELAPLEDVGAGLRTLLQRRLLAFARDTVNRHLSPLGGLHHSEQPAVRAITYQLEHGLGTASTKELGPSLSVLSAAGQQALRGTGLIIGELAIWLPSTLTRAALERRAVLTSVFEPHLALPPVGKTNFETRALSATVWRCLGFVELGPRACRVDLAERAAQALMSGASEHDALRSLSIPRRDALRVARAIRDNVLPRAPAA